MKIYPLIVSIVLTATPTIFSDKSKAKSIIPDIRKSIELSVEGDKKIHFYDDHKSAIEDYSESLKFNSRNTQPAARMRDARFFDFPSFSSRSVTATGSRGSRNGRCQASDALGDFALVEHREAQPDPRPQVPLLVPRLVRVIIILAIIIIASGRRCGSGGESRSERRRKTRGQV